MELYEHELQPAYTQLLTCPYAPESLKIAVEISCTFPMPLWMHRTAGDERVDSL